VGRPEVQKFLVTTSKFSQEATEFAKTQRIILIDGQRLAELMIEHDVGRLDENFFDEDD
jgi:restriction system protein